MSLGGGGRRGSGTLRRRAFLAGLTAVGGLATSGLAAGRHDEWPCFGVEVAYVDCRTATVSAAHILSSMTVYATDADGNRTVAAAVPPATTATYGPVRVQYLDQLRTTRVLATGAGASLVRIIAEGHHCRTAVTNPTPRCVPDGYNAAPQADFEVSPDAPRAGQEFRLTASVTDPDLPADRLNLEWELDGDGSVRTGNPLRHSYETTTPASAVLRVVDDFDVMTTVRRTITPTPSSYRQVQAIFGEDPFSGQRFGNALAADSTHLLVVAGSEPGSRAGTVYERSAGTWTAAARLHASAGETSRVYGSAAALDEDTALVGARGNSTHGDNAGAAFVFTRTATGEWTTGQKLTAADADEFDGFGVAVALHGDTVLVGALGNKLTANDPGGVYVFERDGTDFAQTAKLVPPGLGKYAGTVSAVAIDGDLALVGVLERYYGPGVVHVYRRTGGGWAREAALVPADGVRADYFGYDVALDGDEALVSAPWRGTDGPAGRVAAAYHFVRNADGTWREASMLTAADGRSAGGFGMSVDLAGDLALLGAPSDTHAGRMSGSAYVFGRTATGWTQEANLVAIDATADERFGWQVALAGPTAVAGAPWSDRFGFRAGAVMAFEPR